MAAKTDNPPLPQQQIPVSAPVSKGTGTVSAEAVADNAVAINRIRSFFIPGPVGRLEALLNEGSSDAPFVAIVCHPHPKGGGTMNNKVVYHAAKVFSGLGWPVIRFNFRGTGLSEGEHHGHEEVEDVRAALDWFAAEFGKPIVGCGFSFGSVMGLQACSTYLGNQGQGIQGQGIQGFAALGLPTAAEGRRYSYPFLPDCTFPKLFLSGDRDQYAPVESLRAIVATAPSPTQFELVNDADHFFLGHLPAMQTLLQSWIEKTFLNARSTLQSPEVPVQ